MLGLLSPSAKELYKLCSAKLVEENENCLANLALLSIHIFSISFES